MNLSNRIYSRKILYRLIYMFNFYKFFLNKNIYVDFADKIDNIIKLGFDKIDVKEFEKYNFTDLSKKHKTSLMAYNLDDYISFFDVNNQEFSEILSYTMDYFVKGRDGVDIDFDYIKNNLNYLNCNYDSIIKQINSVLTSFQFVELNSVDQSILLLGFSEFFFTKTPKQVIIKECLLLCSSFSGTSSSKLINAVFDKTLN